LILSWSFLLAPISVAAHDDNTCINPSPDQRDECLSKLNRDTEYQQSVATVMVGRAKALKEQAESTAQYNEAIETLKGQVASLEALKAKLDALEISSADESSKLSILSADKFLKATPSQGCNALPVFQYYCEGKHRCLFETDGAICSGLANATSDAGLTIRFTCGNETIARVQTFDIKGSGPARAGKVALNCATAP
jgi:hypothetical protein